MNNNDFLNEMMEYRKNDYEYFVKFQNIVLDMFDATHKILFENGVNYYAAFGTLLGAYRDKGFIPWDTDFDILISIDDMRRVQKLLEENLPKDYYIVSNLTDKNYRYYQMRVCKKGYDDRLHLDIFYYFGVPEDSKKMAKYKKKTLKLFKIKKNINRAYEFRVNKVVSAIYNLGFFLMKVKYCLISKKQIDKMIEKHTTKYPVATAKKYSVFEEFCYNFDSKLFGTPQVLEFDGHKICAPEDIEGMLNVCYKSFASYPSINSRIAEYEKLLATLKDIDNKKQNTLEDYRN